MTSRRMTRREVVLGLMAASALGSGCATVGRYRTATGRFRHGVASGDPGADSVVIWTRVTPSEPSLVDVRWEVATDPDFRQVIRRGTTVTAGEIDYTVKAVVGNLEPGRAYYYRFGVGNVVSPAGRTRTLPHASAERVRLAVISCSHYSFGFYNVYREIALRDELDAVIHLGDYIYESSADGSGSDYGAERGRQLGRVHDPARTAVTLDDYRRRYAQYRSDPDLQAAHARHPFIAVWDDHETANDAWSGGALAHDPLTQGKWTARRDAALQAYFEWLPLREPGFGLAPFEIDRSYDFGRIASVHLIDSRFTGRTEQFDYENDMIWQEAVFDLTDPDDPVRVTDAARADALAESVKVRLRIPFDIRSGCAEAVYHYETILRYERDGLPQGFEYWPDIGRTRSEILADPTRRALSRRQEGRLRERVTRSAAEGVPWQVLASTVIMARMDSPDFSRRFPDELTRAARESNPWVDRWLNRSRYGLPISVDAWDGYPAARQRIYDMMRETDAGFVVISGDSHNFWMNELHDDRDNAVVGVEFATASATSMGGYEWFGNDPRIFDISERVMVEECRDVTWFDARHRGFVLLELGPDDARANYIAVDTVFSRDYTAKSLAQFAVEQANPRRVRRDA